MEKSIKQPEHYLLAAYLRHLREKSGWTQAELARRLGKPQGFVSSVEQGYRRLDYFQLRQLLAVFGLTMVRGVSNVERLITTQEVPDDWKPPKRTKRRPQTGRLLMKRAKRSR